MSWERGYNRFRGSAQAASGKREGRCRLRAPNHVGAASGPKKHESPLARGGFRIAGAGFEPATFGL